MAAGRFMLRLGLAFAACCGRSMLTPVLGILARRLANILVQKMGVPATATQLSVRTTAAGQRFATTRLSVKATRKKLLSAKHYEKRRTFAAVLNVATRSDQYSTQNCITALWTTRYMERPFHFGTCFTRYALPSATHYQRQSQRTYLTTYFCGCFR